MVPGSRLGDFGRLPLNQGTRAKAPRREQKAPSPPWLPVLAPFNLALGLTTGLLGRDHAKRGDQDSFDPLPHLASLPAPHHPSITRVPAPATCATGVVSCSAHKGLLSLPTDERSWPAAWSLSLATTVPSPSSTTGSSDGRYPQDTSRLARIRSAARPSFAPTSEEFLHYRRDRRQGESHRVTARQQGQWVSGAAPARGGGRLGIAKNA